MYCTKTVAVSSTKRHALKAACFKYAARHKRGLIFTEKIAVPMQKARAAVPIIDINVFDSDSDVANDSNSDGSDCENDSST